MLLPSKDLLNFIISGDDGGGGSLPPHLGDRKLPDPATPAQTANLQRSPDFKEARGAIRVLDGNLWLFFLPKGNQKETASVGAVFDCYKQYMPR